MNMAERLPVVELQRGQHYYLAAYGIFEFTGVMGSSIKNHPDAKKFKNASEVYRFKPHPEYSSGKEKLIARESISQGAKVFNTPSHQEIAAALQIVKSKPEQISYNIEFTMKTGNLLQLAEILRDTKRMPGEKLHQEARAALACVLGYHLQAAIGEAQDYLHFLISPSWPDKLDPMPPSREVMNRIIAHHKDHDAFLPSFIESLAQVAAVPSPTHLGDPHRRERVKTFNPIFYDRAAPLTLECRLYKELALAVADNTGMLALLDAAVVTETMQKEVLYLTRTMFTDKLSLSSVALSKNKERAPGEPEWDSSRVREYYHALIDKLLEAVPEDDHVAAHDAAALLYRTIDVKHSRTSRAPAPVTAVQIPEATKPVNAELVGTSVVLSLDDVSIPAGPATYDAADRIMGQFSIAVRRRPGDPISPAVIRELSFAPHTFKDGAIALLAADQLSPIAFEVFSGVALRKKSMEEVAIELGAHEHVIKKIFTQAAHVVREATEGLVRSNAVRPSLEGHSHKKTLG